MNIYIESSGSLVSASIIKSIQSAGFRAIASDVTSDSVGKYLADDFILSPFNSDPKLWGKLKKMMIDNEINAVFPSFDPSLYGWSCRKEEFVNQGTNIILSDSSTVKIFQDKYETYNFFLKEGVRTPETSLEKDFSLVKPRIGSGANGVIFNAKKNISMDGMISQEFISGDEYTVDVFCDKNGNPLYILPRLRLGIIDGKSTSGVIVKDEIIQKEVGRICQIIKFNGPVNFQCIKSKDSKVTFLEVNPRISGGMALSFSASENWINLAVQHFIFGHKINPKRVIYGHRMLRHYSEIFF